MEATFAEALCFALFGAFFTYFMILGHLHILYRRSLQKGADEGQRLYRKALREIGSKYGIRFKNGEWTQDNDHCT